MTRSLALVLLAAGCSTLPADDIAPAEATAAPASAEPAETELDRTDLREIVHSADVLLEQVKALSPARRAQLAESMRVLSVNCPYTRATLQLPITIDKVVSEIDPAQIAPEMREEWKTLQRGLRSHMAVLDAIEIDLSQPLPGDHLFSSLDPDAMIDRATLTEKSDPVGATMHLIESNDSLVGAMDQGTKDLIRMHTDSAYDAMGPTSMYWQTGGWHEALKEAIPHASDPQTRATLEAIVAALDQHTSQGC